MGDPGLDRRDHIENCHFVPIEDGAVDSSPCPSRVHQLSKQAAATDRGLVGLFQLGSHLSDLPDAW